MTTFPINLVLKGRSVVVVGGGVVGGRKVRLLVHAGAEVTVVDPRPLSELSLPAKAVAHVASVFEGEHLLGATLAFAATNDPVVNARVVQEARARGVLVNRADAPGESDFHVPATLTRGELVVSVSSGGTCPGFSQVMKWRIEALFGEEVGAALEIVAAARRWLMEQQEGWVSRGSYRPLVTDGFLRACRRGDTHEIERLLAEALGEGCTLEELGVVPQSSEPRVDRTEGR